MSDEKTFFECIHCEKKLSSEARLELHLQSCKIKLRKDELKSLKGQKAFKDYMYWLRKYKKNNSANVDSFVNSKFFISFMELQDFFVDKGIPDKRLYMDFMMKKQVTPILWRMNDAYLQFIDHFDLEIGIDRKIDLTISLIDKLASIFECERFEVFYKLLPSEISRLIFERRLSPWVLLCSKSFLNYLSSIKNPVQYNLITTTIGMDEWKKRFKECPDIIANIRKRISSEQL